MPSRVGTAPSIDGSALEDVLASRPRLRLLRYLSTHDGAFTGRELARAVGLDPKRASVALRQLTDAGLVRRRQAGSAYLYSLNRDHYLVSESIQPAFRRETRWLDALGEHVQKALAPVVESVILYGSVARGEESPRSDLDLLIVLRPGARPGHAEAQLADQSVRLLDRFARIVSFVVMTRDEFRRRLRRREALAMEIAIHGRVLAGRTIPQMIGRG